MMIAIKGMKMPTECEYCGFCRYYPENGNVWCNANNRILKLYWKEPDWTHLDVKRPDWCPLIEINTDGDTISRQEAIDAICAVCGNDCDKSEFVYNAPQDEQVILCPEHYCLCNLPSAQPEPLSDAYMNAVWTWLIDYQIKAAELKGRYTPYEVLSLVVNDWRKEHERSDKQTGSD